MEEEMMITSFECRLCQGQFSTFDELNQHWKDSPCGLSSRTSKDHVIALSSDGQVIALTRAPIESLELLKEAPISDVTSLGNQVEIDIAEQDKLESCSDQETSESTSVGGAAVVGSSSAPEDPGGVSMVTSLIQVEVRCVQTEVEPVVSTSMSDVPILIAQEVSLLNDVNKDASVDGIVAEGILHNQEDEPLHEGILEQAAQMTQLPTSLRIGDSIGDREVHMDMEIKAETNTTVNDYVATDGEKKNEIEVHSYEVAESDDHTCSIKTSVKSLDTVLTVPQIPWLLKNRKGSPEPLKQKHKKPSGRRRLRSEKKFCCEVCGKTYSKSSNLYRHKQVHTGQNHVCDRCNKSFKYRETLKIHKKACQANPDQPNQFNCQHCADVFTSSSRLTIHLTTHFPEKKMNCALCQKSFITKGGLKRHLLNHTGERKHKCDVCFKSFITKSSLKQHKLIHAEDKPYACSICLKSFVSVKLLRTHQVTHNPNQPYTCQICSKSFKTAQFLKTHQVIHTRSKVHPCTKCSAKFGTKKEVIFHMRTHWKAEHKDGTLLDKHQCGECGEKFTQRGSLRAHERSHTGERPYKCFMCSKAFTYYSSWYQHMKIHRGEKTYVCKKCKRGFTKRIYLNRHKNGFCTGRRSINKSKERTTRKSQDGDHLLCEKKRLHKSVDGSSLMAIPSEKYSVSKCNDTIKTSKIPQDFAATEEVVSTGFTTVPKCVIDIEVKPFACEICGKMYKSSSNLQRHKKTHENKKPFICKICGKGYSRKPILIEHEMVAHGEGHTKDLHKCPDCPMSYPTIARLNVHRRKHTGERPFKCRFCPKAFKESGNLKRHERIHFDLKPFKCVVCDRGFNDKGNLQKHEVTHGIKGEEDRAKADSWKPFSCPECGKNFKQLGYLRYHQRVHQQDKVYSCTECGRSFTQAANYKLHMKSHTEKPFRCQVCCKPYRKESKLEKHIETSHPVKKSFVCTHCGKELSSKASLQKHEQKHQEPLNHDHDSGIILNKKITPSNHFSLNNDGDAVLFKCDRCQILFTSQDERNQHEQECSTSSVYKCKTCERTFFSKSGLATHQRTHKVKIKIEDVSADEDTSKKLYSCKICHVKFSKKKSFKKHKKEHKGK